METEAVKNARRERNERIFSEYVSDHSWGMKRKLARKYGISSTQISGVIARERRKLSAASGKYEFCSGEGREQVCRPLSCGFLRKI